MQRVVLLTAAIVVVSGTSFGQSTKARVAPKVVRLVVAKENSDDPTMRFSTDAHKIRAIWKGSGLQVGDKLHAVWVADDVGESAPRHTPITMSDVTIYKPDDDGVFALGRPKEGWPPGKYRIELYLNKKLTNTQSFVIERGAMIETQPPEGSQMSAPLQEEPSPAVQPKQ